MLTLLESTSGQEEEPKDGSLLVSRSLLLFLFLILLAILASSMLIFLGWMPLVLLKRTKEALEYSAFTF